MRLVVSLVIIALGSPCLPAAEALDLSDLEQAAQSNAADADRWTQRRQRMRADFDRITALAERLTAEQRTQAWQRFLAAYAEKDPYDGADEELRAQARAGLGTPAAAPQPPGAADPERLAQAAAAYLQAKRKDLEPGGVEARRRAWEEFLAAHGGEIAGTTADDEMRRWARIRLDGLAQDPPAILPAPLLVYPDLTLDEGTRIVAVEEGGLAHRLGLRPGDLIIAAGQPPHDLVGVPAALYAYVAGLRRDDDLRLVVIRGDMVVAVPAAPARPQARAPVPARPAPLGLRCLETPTALTVGAVDPGQVGACAGLDAGDRIAALAGAPVAGIEALEAAYAALPAEAPLELDIVRAGVRHRLSVPAAGGDAAWSVVDADAGWAAAPPPYRVPEIAPGPTPEPAEPTPPADAPAAAAPEPAAAPPAAAAAAPVDLGLGFERRDDGVLRIVAVAPGGVAARLGAQKGDMLVGMGDPPRMVRAWTLQACLAACTDPSAASLVIVRHAPSLGKSVRRISVLPLPPPPEERAMRAPATLRGLGFNTYDILPIVSDLVPGGFAEAIGLMPGDRLLTLDGRVTQTTDDIERILRTSNADPIVLGIRTWNGAEWQVSLPRAGGDAAWQRTAPATAR